MSNVVHNELNHLLKDYYPFTLLTDIQLKEMADKSTQAFFSKNELIFHEDESAEHLDLFFLVSGLAKNILHHSNGKQLSLRYYYPGDIIGLMVMFTSGELNFSVQALEDCTVFKLNKKHFYEMMTRNTDFSKVIWESIGERTKSIYDEIKNNTVQDDHEHMNLLKTRVSKLMTPPYFIDSQTKMSEAASILMKNEATGLIVSNHQSTLNGVMTNQEIMNFVSNNGNHHDPVLKWMNPSPLTVNTNSFSFEALSIIKNKPIEFIPVTTNGKVIGVLTSKAFLNLEDMNYLDLTYNVKKATNVSILTKQGPISNLVLHDFVTDLLNNESYAYDVTEAITNHNDNLHRQVIKLTLNEMKKEGHGTPPITFCFITMGSQARHEQGFHTDQDNGLILHDYEHLPNKQQIEHYFTLFSRKINDYLSNIGFPKCTGGIMAEEKKWRKSLSKWKEEIHTWRTELDAQEIQNFTMFYDFRPIYGDFSLAEEIRGFLTETTKKSKTLHQLLMKDALRYRIPSHPFGLLNIKQKNKFLNIKKTGLTQIIYSTRINAMKYGINEVSTIKRLDELKKIQAMHPRDVQNAKTALHYFHYYRLLHNLNQLKQGISVSNDIMIMTLSKEDRMRLKEALQVAHRMQQVTKISFNRNRVV